MIVCTLRLPRFGEIWRSARQLEARRAKFSALADPALFILATICPNARKWP